jgi:hypothetical protein
VIYAPINRPLAVNPLDDALDRLDNAIRARESVAVEGQVDVIEHYLRTAEPEIPS